MNVTSRTSYSDHGHRLLMVGFNRPLIAELNAIMPRASLTVLEEPNVYQRKGLAAVREVTECISEVILAPYQQSEHFLPEVLAAHARAPFSAVLPGQEYGVTPAAIVAARLGLPGAGIESARILSDKLLLREVTSKAGMAAPMFLEVHKFEDVEAFLSRSDGRAVLKPANRQASLGVTVIDSAEEAEYAWTQLVTAEEPRQVSDRAWHHRYLIEERLHGPEVSVEALVVSGRINFSNVTQKITAGGSHPVETGHVLPAPLAATVEQLLRESMEALVDAVGFDTGILHAEWIIQGGRPVLIECAGRAPGDYLCDLINLAYGFSFIDTARKILAGADATAPIRPKQGAAITFLTAAPGTVTNVSGLDEARATPGVVEAVLTAEVGDSVRTLRNSGDRLGFVIATAPDSSAAGHTADHAASLIKILTDRNEAGA
ncbi:ATP-grasp domain-containing protein [Streptomyces sp. NPDC001222]|uniref:ATP-grasp domain-containing protein n=1 Tax=Streptomyces sp. NPDC001222 TaxID=3364548 RepID=UPI003673EDC9